MNLFLAFYLDVGILDVGGANPKDVLHVGAVGEDAGVVGGVGDEGGGRGIISFCPLLLVESNFLNHYAFIFSSANSFRKS